MKLHKIKGKNKYCGPAALSAAFGISSQYAAKLIRTHCCGHGGGVKGTSGKDLKKVFDHYGVQSTADVRISRNKQFTFNHWVKETFPHYPNSTFIVAVKNHWITIHNGYFIDRVVSKNKPVLISDYPHPRAKVTDVIEITGGTLPAEPKKKSILNGKPESIRHLVSAYANHYGGDIQDTWNDLLEDDDFLEGYKYDHQVGKQVAYPRSQEEADFHRWLYLADSSWVTDFQGPEVRTINMLLGKWGFIKSQGWGDPAYVSPENREAA